MTVDAETARQAAKRRQRFDKPAEPQTVPTPEPAPAATERPSTGTRAQRSSGRRGRRRKPKSPEETARAEDVEAVLEQARAEADQARAEAAEAAGVTVSVNGGPKLTKAERQRLRRLRLRHIAVEISISSGGQLDRLAEQHGTQRAAIEHAIALAFDLLDSETGD